MKPSRTVLTLLTGLILLLFSGCVTLYIGGRSPRDRLKETTVRGGGWNKILVLDITGFLSNLPTSRPYAPPLTLLRDVKEKLRKAEKDHRIKGVLLRVNSPGGTVSASDTIYEEIRRFKERTGLPVVAQLLDTGASGGYYVSLAADRIYAEPTSITGSIGVILQKFNIQDLLSRIGVDNTPVKSGPHKDIGSPFRSRTPEENRILQETIDTLYNRFVDIVDKNRKDLTREQVLALSDGRIYTAKQALENHLIDRIGYMEDAIEDLKQMAGIHKARIILYRLPNSYKENIYSAARIPPVNEIHLFGLKGNLPVTGTPFLYFWTPTGE